MDTKPEKEEEEEELLLENSPPSRKGGFRTMPFIIVNESFEKVASYGLLPNMILYLMNDYSLDAATGSSIIYLWLALSNLLSIFGAVAADSYFGRFWVISIGSISSLLGMVLLWLTAAFPQLRPSLCDQYSNICNFPQAVQLGVLFLSFGLISVGAGCVRPCSIAFGADQLVNLFTSANKDRLLDAYFNWYYASAALSSIVSVTVIVYIQDRFGWNIGFAVPVILMSISVSVFLFGSSLYVKVKVRESLFSGFFQVLVAAFRKRNTSPQITNLEPNYYYKDKSMMRTPSNDWRVLNNACIIEDPDRDLNPDGSASNPWRLCNVEQVESLKFLLRALPMWSSGIVLLVSLSASFTVLQAKTMDRRIISNIEIPAGSFGLFLVISLTLWIFFYNCILVPLLRRYTSHQHGISPILRMGIGLVIGTIAMAVSAIVERRRRWLAIKAGFEDDVNALVDMSAMWLVPQEVLLGLAEAFNAIGQMEFFYSQFPKSMSSIAVALYSLEMAVANLVGSGLVKIVDNVTEKIDGVSWLSSNINKGHLDYYCWLVSFLNVINFLYFLICYRKIGQPDRIEENDDERT